MKTPIKLEDFQRGDISIECSSQEQVDAVAKWVGVGTDKWTNKFKYADYFQGTVFTWGAPNPYNYKFADVELID
jgi:hypothetical protein